RTTATSGDLNIDIREALADAERALATGDRAAAARAYVEAGDHAVRYQLWRSAARSFRSALELDLVARDVVAKLVGLRHLRAVADWLDYQDALDAHPDWPHVSCLRAQVLIDDRGAYVDCGLRVLRLAMTSDDHVEVRPEPRFSEIPLAMALVVLRRAMWPNARDQALQPMRLRVTYSGRPSIWLDELGDWEPV
ncbi:MAG TPA: hypothetical protein VIV58_18255, partial [Kofleriaceae bacterium]